MQLNHKEQIKSYSFHEKLFAHSSLNTNKMYENITNPIKSMVMVLKDKDGT